MEEKLYRKSAIDKISSPEQLNEYMRVTGPGVWVMLGAVAVIFAAFFVWGFSGSIPETVPLTGTALAPYDAPLAVYCYLPIDETKQLAKDMEVRVSPDYAPKEQFGYIYGNIKSISQTPVTTEKLRSDLGDHFAFLPAPSGNTIEVIIELERRDGALKWSSSKGASIDVTVGSTCALTVVTSERRPYELMLR